jgi:hypothetical protein
VFAATSLFLINKNKKYDFLFLPRHSYSNNNWDNMLDSESLTWATLVKYLMWTNHSSCKLSPDIEGHVKDNPSATDGQKAVCIDRQVAPNISALYILLALEAIGLLTNKWNVMVVNFFF